MTNKKTINKRPVMLRLVWNIVGTRFFETQGRFIRFLFIIWRHNTPKFTNTLTNNSLYYYSNKSHLCTRLRWI